VPRQVDEKVLLLGKRLVRAFFVLHKTAANYAPGHPALSQPLAELAAVVEEFERRREEALLGLREDHLFAGEMRLKPDAAGFEAFFTTIRVLRRVGVGTLVFTRRAEPAAVEAWFGILRELEAAPPEDPFAELERRMAERGIAGIEVERAVAVAAQPAPVDLDAKERSKAIYAQTLEVISEVMDHVKLGKALRLKRAKRVVQAMIDQLLTAETNLLGLTNIRCHDEYTYNHSVNVGILSMAVGQRVGLGKNALVDLGMSAIFHDIGKSCIPLAVLNKPTALDEPEWAVMQRHPVYGVKELLKLKGVDALTARIMLGAFEHHLGIDGSGYPQVPYERKVSLPGRIIAIADCYDALTSSRVYRREAEPPDVTLRYILQKSGTLYDPVLSKLFVNALGLYPVGTLCLLSTHELAVVVENNPDPERWETPRVQVIADPGGSMVEGRLADLADPQAERRIVQTLDARKLGIDVARYFV
jgi:HD-GYP domain-containing protein (c-di-GMP phosphodiesterase class II)